jgi:V/A-type H+/Na+-transporting ATPase subunit C
MEFYLKMTHKFKFNPYTYARICAMKSLLYNKLDYDKLMKLSISEITKYLQDRIYTDEINELSINYSGIKLIELALNKHLTKIIRKIVKISDPDTTAILQIYLKKYEILNLKTLIRGKSTKSHFEDIKTLLIPIGIYNLSDLEKIYKLPLSNIIKQLPKECENHEELFDIENILDFSYYKELNELKSKLLEKNLTDYISLIIDIHNIKLILKSKRFGVETNLTSNYLLQNNSTNINIPDLMHSKDFDSAIDVLKKSKYHKLVDENFIEKYEVFLDKFVLDSNKKLFHKKPLSSDVVFSYVFSKEIEVRNIRTIAKSKLLNFEDKQIQKLIIR